MNLDEARRLIVAWGRNPTSWQILNPGISRWSTDDGTGLVGYVRRRGTWVAAGDPVTRPDRLETTARAFERSAGESPVCWFCAGPELVRIFEHDPAHSAVLIGAQPVWHPDSWIRKLQKHPSLRAQLRRAANKGVRVEEWEAARATSDAELRDCLRQWLEARPFPPLQFLVEPRTLDRPEGRRIFVALVGNRPIGYALLSPVPQRNGWLVEQFVRRPSAPNGTAELMVTRAVEAVASEGYEYITLGLAPLSRHAGIPGEGQPRLRLLFGWLRLHGNRFYNFSGLDFFKSKFDPDAWEPVYALADRSRLSFRMLYSVAAAFSNGSPVANLLRAVVRAGLQEIRWLFGRR